MSRYCTEFQNSDHLNRLRNEKRKDRQTERTAGQTTTRRAVDAYYAGAL